MCVVTHTPTRQRSQETIKIAGIMSRGWQGNLPMFFRSMDILSGKAVFLAPSTTLAHNRRHFDTAIHSVRHTSSKASFQ
jgi:hypothetical protein